MGKSSNEAADRTLADYSIGSDCFGIKEAQFTPESTKKCSSQLEFYKHFLGLTNKDLDIRLELNEKLVEE